MLVDYKNFSGFIADFSRLIVDEILLIVNFVIFSRDIKTAQKFD